MIVGDPFDTPISPLFFFFEQGWKYLKAQIILSLHNLFFSWQFYYISLCPCFSRDFVYPPLTQDETLKSGLKETPSLFSRLHNCYPSLNDLVFTSFFSSLLLSSFLPSLFSSEDSFFLRPFPSPPSPLPFLISSTGPSVSSGFYNSQTYGPTLFVVSSDLLGYVAFHRSYLSLVPSRTVSSLFSPSQSPVDV